MLIKGISSLHAGELKKKKKNGKNKLNGLRHLDSTKDGQQYWSTTMAFKKTTWGRAVNAVNTVCFKRWHDLKVLTILIAKASSLTDDTDRVQCSNQRRDWSNTTKEKFRGVKTQARLMKGVFFFFLFLRAGNNRLVVAQNLVTYSPTQILHLSPSVLHLW